LRAQFTEGAEDRVPAMKSITRPSSGIKPPVRERMS
jgi:hypothetical protein